MQAVSSIVQYEIIIVLFINDYQFKFCLYQIVTTTEETAEPSKTDTTTIPTPTSTESSGGNRILVSQLAVLPFLIAGLLVGSFHLETL